MPDFNALAQRYIDIWNDTDPTSRRKAIEKLWAPDADYIDPMIEVRGHDAIDAAVAGVQAQFPGFVFQLIGPVDAHHQQARFRWDLGPRGCEAPVAGFDVALTDDAGQLRTVLGFLDRVPAS